jgi:maltodextrin utilization protein YvdJ
MKKFLAIFMISFLLTPLFAVDFSEMSTQELIEIIGYVKKENRAKFERELQSRVSTMSQKEKQEYIKNMQKAKSKR